MNSQLHLRNTKRFNDQWRKKDSKASEQWGLVPQRDSEAASGEGHGQVSDPGRDQSSLLCGSAVALTISKYLATTKLKWLCTSVSHDVLDSYRKQDRRKQEHSHGAQLQITILANIKGYIPLWVDASTTWSKCCVFLRIKATPVQVKTIAE